MTLRNRILLGMAWTAAATVWLGAEPLRAAEPQPRQAVRLLRVNNGQEVLVEVNGEGRSVRLSCTASTTPLATTLGATSNSCVAKTTPGRE